MAMGKKYMLNRKVKDPETGEEIWEQAGQWEEAGWEETGRKRDRSDIAKSGDFSACPYCQ
jgi:hypothetical protein